MRKDNWFVCPRRLLFPTFEMLVYKLDTLLMVYVIGCNARLSWIRMGWWVLLSALRYGFPIGFGSEECGGVTPRAMVTWSDVPSAPRGVGGVHCMCSRHPGSVDMVGAFQGSHGLIELAFVLESCAMDWFWNIRDCTSFGLKFNKLHCILWCTWICFQTFSRMDNEIFIWYDLLNMESFIKDIYSIGRPKFSIIALSYNKHAERF